MPDETRAPGGPRPPEGYIGTTPVWFCQCGAVVWDQAAHYDVQTTVLEVVNQVRAGA